MKVIAEIKNKEKYLVEITSREIGNILGGRFGSYTDYPVGTEIQVNKIFEHLIGLKDNDGIAKDAIKELSKMIDNLKYDFDHVMLPKDLTE